MQNSATTQQFKITLFQFFKVVIRIRTADILVY